MQIAFDHPIRNGPKLLAVKAFELGVTTILDVGANLGQFARELRKYGYRGTIISFEPLSGVHSQLSAAAAQDSSWQVAPRMALGARRSAARINIARNLASSSLLPVRDRSVAAEEETAYAGAESVDVYPLDEVIASSWPRPFGLKLDTQGFELQVLRGAPNALASTEIVLAEMSLTPLYEGGATLVDVYEFLEDEGFRCISIVQGFADHARNELLQVDGIFAREHR